MMRIGDFSKLARVPVKTLRYYDEVGLFKPANVDESTGYRYYTVDQLARLNRILALKDLGFSLEEIGRFLIEGLSPEEMRGMLKLRQTEIRHRVREETDRLVRVDSRLQQIEQEQTMSTYDVVLKQVEPLKVASLRGIVPAPPDQGTLWQELEEHLSKHNVRPEGPCLSLYHDDEYKEQDWDIEVCEPIQAELVESERVKVRQLPAIETMACLLHQGPLVTISEAYDAIMKWIGENGFLITGPAREVYLREAKNGNQEDLNAVTEIQFPVRKV